MNSVYWMSIEDPASEATSEVPSGRRSQSQDIHIRTPFGALRIRRDGTFARPTWIIAGTYGLGTALVASGIALMFMDSASTLRYLLPFGAGLLIIFSNSLMGAPSTFDKYADQIRERVDEGSQDSMRIAVESGGTAYVYPQQAGDPATIRASDTLQKQEAILREIYTQGLAQAKLSFRVSLIFLSLGALVLLLGASLAILKAPTTGDKYASIVVTVAGVVIDLTSSVFFVQSNRARKSMGDQGVMLREESQDDRRLSAARELAAAIESGELRDEVRADLARKLLSPRQGDEGEN
jgi:hypothetical protein